MVMPCTTKSLLWGVLFSVPQTWDCRSVIGKVFLRYTKGAKRISGCPGGTDINCRFLMIRVLVVVTDDDGYWTSHGIESCTWLLSKNLSCENISLHFKAASVMKTFQFKMFIYSPLLASILNYVSSLSVSWYPSIFALRILVCLLCLKYAIALLPQGLCTCSALSIDPSSSTQFLCSY